MSDHETTHQNPRPRSMQRALALLAVVVGLLAALVPLTAAPASASPEPTGIVVHNGTPPPKICTDLLGEIADIVQQASVLGDGPLDDLWRVWLFAELSLLLDQYDDLNCDQYAGMPKLT